MKTNKEDVAFPVPDTVAKEILGGYGFPQEYMGLTKREYFAIMAMQGYLAAGNMLDTITPAKAVQRADDLIEILNMPIDDKKET